MLMHIFQKAGSIPLIVYYTASVHIKDSRLRLKGL